MFGPSQAILGAAAIKQHKKNGPRGPFGAWLVAALSVRPRQTDDTICQPLRPVVWLQTEQIRHTGHTSGAAFSAQHDGDSVGSLTVHPSVVMKITVNSGDRHALAAVTQRQADRERIAAFHGNGHSQTETVLKRCQAVMALRRAIRREACSDIETGRALRDQT